MPDVVGRLSHSQGRELLEFMRQNCGILAPDIDHHRELLQKDAAESRLKFRQAPVGPKRFMEPAKARRMLAIEDSLVALAVILIAPGLLPDSFLIGRHHAAFPPSCHDLVLAEGKGTYITKRADRPPLVSGAVTLRAILDHPQSMLTGQFRNRVHIARPAG